MVHLVVFETVKEVEELTGLPEEDLWKLGFNFDDWDIGFQSDTKLHEDPTEEEIKSGDFYTGELIAAYNLPAHWLMNQMNTYCVGANYVELNGMHYYTVHHS